MDPELREALDGLKAEIVGVETRLSRKIDGLDAKIDGVAAGVRTINTRLGAVEKHLGINGEQPTGGYVPPISDAPDPATAPVGRVTPPAVRRGKEAS